MSEGVGGDALFDWSGAPLYGPAVAGGGNNQQGGGSSLGWDSPSSAGSQSPATIAANASSTTTTANSSTSSAARARAASAGGGTAVEWVPDQMAAHCQNCDEAFSALTRRRHHCRRCGGVFCWECSGRKESLASAGPGAKPQRVCDPCFHVLQAQRDSVRHSADSDALAVQFFVRARADRFEFQGSTGDVGRRGRAGADVGVGVDTDAKGKKTFCLVGLTDRKAVLSRVFQASLGRGKPAPQLATAAEQVPAALMQRLIRCGSQNEWMMCVLTPPSVGKLPVPFTATVMRLVQTVSVSHPFLVPVYDVEWIGKEQNQLVFVEPCFHRVGSLKDLIFRSQWRQTYAEKYKFAAKGGQRIIGQPLGIADIQVFGLQVLHALSFLRTLKLLPSPTPHAWLHSGNVMIDQPGNRGTRTALLQGWWMAFALNVPAASDAYLMAVASVPSNEVTAEVAAFGFLFFEMAYGVTLEDVMSDLGVASAAECVAQACAPGKIPPGGAKVQPPAEVLAVLRKIFLSPDASEGSGDAPGPLQVEDVMVMPLFVAASAKVGAVAQPSVGTLFDAKVKSAISKLNGAWAGEEVKASQSRTRRPKQPRMNTKAQARPGQTATASSSAAAAPAARPVSKPVAPSAPAPPSSAPPPAPAPTPAPAGGGGGAGRGALLASIRQGKKLQKAETNDRSGPKV